MFQCCNVFQVRPIPGQGLGPVETTNTETFGLPGPRVSVVLGLIGTATSAFASKRL
jgi:hypothetical protein